MEINIANSSSSEVPDALFLLNPRILYPNHLKYISRCGCPLVLFKKNLLYSHEQLQGGIELVLIPFLYTLLGLPRPGLNLAKTDAGIW